MRVVANCRQCSRPLVSRERCWAIDKERRTTTVKLDGKLERHVQTWTELECDDCERKSRK